MRRLIFEKMNNLLLETQRQFKKPTIVMVKSGDNVKVTQRITEGGKQRLQVFEGLVIRVRHKNSLTYRIVVRKITSGVGVEKSFLMHSPNVVKVEVVKRFKVRRNYLSYMRSRLGKSARLKPASFNKETVNKGVKTDAIVSKLEDKLEDKPSEKTSQTDEQTSDIKEIKQSEEKTDKPETKDEVVAKEDEKTETPSDTSEESSQTPKLEASDQTKESSE